MITHAFRRIDNLPIRHDHPPALLTGRPLKPTAKSQLAHRAAEIQNIMVHGRFTQAGYERMSDQLKFIQSCFVQKDTSKGLNILAPKNVQDRITKIQHLLVTARFTDLSMRASYEGELKFLQGLQANTGVR